METTPSHDPYGPNPAPACPPGRGRVRTRPDPFGLKLAGDDLGRPPAASHRLRGAGLELGDVPAWLGASSRGRPSSSPSSCSSRSEGNSGRRSRNTGPMRRIDSETRGQVSLLATGGGYGSVAE